MKPSDDRCASCVHPEFNKNDIKKNDCLQFTCFVHSVANAIDKVQLHELFYLTFMTKFFQPRLSHNLLQSKSLTKPFQTLTCPT